MTCFYLELTLPQENVPFETFVDPKVFNTRQVTS